MTARSRTPLVIVAVIIVAAVAGLLAVVLTRDSDDDSTSDGGTATTATGADAAGDQPADDALVYGAVEISGDPLPEFTRRARRSGDRHDTAGHHRHVVRRRAGRGGPRRERADDGRVPGPLVPALQRRDPGAQRVARFGRRAGRPRDHRGQHRCHGPAAELPARPVAAGPRLDLAGDGRRRGGISPQGLRRPGYPYFVVLGADGTVKARARRRAPRRPARRPGRRRPAFA